MTTLVLQVQLIVVVGVPLELAMHSHILVHGNICECIPRYWEDHCSYKCIPIYRDTPISGNATATYWVTPVHGEALRGTGVPHCQGMHSQILEHPSIRICIPIYRGILDRHFSIVEYCWLPLGVFMLLLVVVVVVVVVLVGVSVVVDEAGFSPISMHVVKALRN
jgi:hypothetical protein